ncbi:spondin domain-containing protein [Cellvibrio mixtus]|uniref:spondin domain-containing protein n=1 Tax=Cellvibrio mixtus TaxID=39650 RepID=UPI0006949982|nr:spondin domain-containing protein [Cellvibrio mixtus]
MKHQLSSLICIALVLGGCGGSHSTSHTKSSSSMAISSMMAASSNTAMMSSIATVSSQMANSSMAATTELKYSITVTNLTAGQPFSPLTYSFHYSGFSPFTIGMPATIGLEKIAESGANDDFLAAAMANPDVVLADHAAGLTLPGETKMLSVNLNSEMANINQLRFSVVSMLANTNDGFSGVNSIAIGELAVGESLTINAMSYDAGTEMNSESQATIPGPAGGGESFAARDDMVNHVTMHPGVVTRDDGKMDSTLTQMHRWDNPVARIVITRLTP